MKADKIESLTVLMTTYNACRFIEKTVQSVLEQSFTNFEFLIIDDGSTDNTEDIIKSFYDSRIRYERIKHVGRSGALNYGLKISNHNWIALIDSDDLWIQNKLQIQIELNSLSSRSIIISDAAYFKNSKIQYLITMPENESDLFKIFALHGHIPNSSVIYCRDEILNIGGYNTKLENSEDYELWLRAMHRFQFIIINRVLVYCRINNDSLSRKNLEHTYNNIYSIQDYYYNQFNKSFSSIEASEEFYIKGWREFFYGSKLRALHFWIKKKPSSLMRLKVLIAIISTIIPIKISRYIKEQNPKFRVNMLLNYGTIKKNNDILTQLLIK